MVPYDVQQRRKGMPNFERTFVHPRVHFQRSLAQPTRHWHGEFAVVQESSGHALNSRADKVWEGKWADACLRPLGL